MTTIIEQFGWWLVVGMLGARLAVVLLLAVAEAAERGARRVPARIPLTWPVKRRPG